VGSFYIYNKNVWQVKNKPNISFAPLHYHKSVEPQFNTAKETR